MWLIMWAGNSLQLTDVLGGGGGRNVTAVQQDMAVDLLDALGVGLTQQGDQVVDVGMDVAVGQQAQEVHGLALFLGVGSQLLPGLGLVDGAVLNGLADQLGTLGVDLTTAQSIVADLRVAHILVAGQTDGGAVGLQPGVGAGCEQIVEGGGVGQLDSIAAAAVALADAVHDYENNGFLHCKYLQKM